MQTTRRTILAAAGAAALTRPLRAQSTALKIGVLNDQSGIYKDLSGPVSVACVKQAIAEMTPHGITAEVLVGDHQNKPDIGAAITRQWIDRDGVDMVIDIPNSAVALAVANVCREKDKVYINSGAGTVDLTGSQCAATTVHWTYDTWMLAHSTGGAMVKQGGTHWFFITADYAFGAALEKDTTAFVKSAGGTVVGSIKHPPGATDFSSYLLQAQASGANVIGLCNAGSDTVNCIKQAAEFGLDRGKTKLAALLVFISDVNALGLLRRARPDPQRDLLLGPQRPHPRLRQPRRPGDRRRAARHEPRRLLRRHAALPQSRRRPGRHRRQGQRQTVVTA